MNKFRRAWFSNIKGDTLSGIIVALALIPEAIGFSIIAGVDPKVGLYASFSIAVIISITGGRPAMISAATAATAVLMITLVRDHGLEYLLAATILAGVIQVIAGFCRIGYVMRFISRSVITGFVNALAIMIFMAQLPEIIGMPWETYAMIAVGLFIIYFFPYVTKVIPSPLICIIVLTIISFTIDVNVRTVGDLGALPDSFPVFLIPNIPFNLDTLMIIFPYSISVAAVGLLESLLTAVIVDQMTDTKSNKNREAIGQGIANFFTGFLGGMAGCAMIGQSVINVKSGGRSRLSTFLAGIFLLFLILVLGDIIRIIPMPALVSIMIVVSIGTFNWASFRQLLHHPRRSSIVMLSTVVVVVSTHNLALGVGVGVLLSGIFFAWKVSQDFRVISAVSDDGQRRNYVVEGQLFFATADDFVDCFNFKEPLKQVCIDISRSHIWDLTGVNAIDKVVLKFRREFVEVELVGMNIASETIMDKLAIHNDPKALKGKALSE